MVVDSRGINKWREVDGITGIFEHTVGRRVIRRVIDRQQCPLGPWAGSEEFEAVEFDDGSWIAIEYDPGSPGYSSWTPGSPGYCYMYLLPPAE